MNSLSVSLCVPACVQVPDIQRLMDQSKLRRARMFRHKAELMYRSSVNNSDRTTILLHNNPLPDITELGGQADSISRYLPSWVDDQSVSAGPGPSFLLLMTVYSFVALSPPPLLVSLYTVCVCVCVRTHERVCVCERVIVCVSSV